MNYLTTAEVAAKLRLSRPGTVGQMIRDGKLPASKIGRRWLIAEDAVDEIVARAVHTQPKAERRRRRRAA